ncbi:MULTISPECIES: DUF2970 domain-containing protein [Halomonas]|jgi:hypothetical protein|uniref:DUF2970 domain-containing protein n=1 Tax=Halomonas mongoliensis TaxID=321265 RepID=A0ABU1GKX1_9GAMM|nr:MULTISPECIES: DUF2970 domain-containing protein [Halomonas]MDR5892669.1 DUF2970 domain-containing protein [Halomonas mongoliensis]
MWKVIRSVLAAFLGVQKEEQRREDFEKGRPLTFIVTGLMLGLLFVALVAAVAIGVAR